MGRSCLQVDRPLCRLRVKSGAVSEKSRSKNAPMTRATPHQRAWGPQVQVGARAGTAGSTLGITHPPPTHTHLHFLPNSRPAEQVLANLLHTTL